MLIIFLCVYAICVSFLYSVFTVHAHLFENIHTIVVGGLQSQPQQQPYSFPGLQVIDSPDFYFMFQELQLNVSTMSVGELNAQNFDFDTYARNGFTTTSDVDLTPRLLPTSAGYRYEMHWKTYTSTNGVRHACTYVDCTSASCCALCIFVQILYS